MRTYKIFNNDLAAIPFKPRKFYWNKPTVVAATILDLTKRQMYWFHCKHMKANFQTLLVYSDTDSLIYEIELEDLYEDLNKNDAIYQEYDFSNYNEDNQLYSKHQKLETLIRRRRISTLTEQIIPNCPYFHLLIPDPLKIRSPMKKFWNIINLVELSDTELDPPIAEPKIFFRHGGLRRPPPRKVRFDSYQFYSIFQQREFFGIFQRLTFHVLKRKISWFCV